MQNITGILVKFDNVGPGVLALACGLLMIWPIIAQAVREQWIGVILSVAAAGMLVNVGIGTASTWASQDLFPASRSWAPPPVLPVQQTAWATSGVLLAICVIMCCRTRGLQVEFFITTLLVALACAMNLRRLSGGDAKEWLEYQRLAEGIALFLLCVFGPVRAIVRRIA